MTSPAVRPAPWPVRAMAAVRGAASRLLAPPSPSGIALRGRPDRRDVRPQSIIQVGAWDRRFDEVQGIIAGHEMGQFAASGVLADVLDRNPRIFGALNNRALGVVGSPLVILPGRGDKRRAARVARDLEEDWPLIAPEATTAQIVRHLTVMGFCLCRARVVSARGRWIPTLEPWHPSQLRYDASRDVLLARVRGEPEQVVTPGDGSWVLFARAPQRPWMCGVVRCLALPSEVRAYVTKDWRTWSEKHGLPLVELRVPASKAESDDTTVWFNQMQDMGSGTTIVSPIGDDGKASYGVNLIEAKDTAWEGFKELIARQDGDVSIAIEGSNLSTENTTVGAKASSQSGLTVKQDLKEADAYIVAATAHAQAIRPWAQWNYGDSDLAPWAVYDPTLPEDLKALGETLKAAGDAGEVWARLAASHQRVLDFDAFAEAFGVRLMPVGTALPVNVLDVDEDGAPIAPEARLRRVSARRFLARHRHQLAA